MKTPVPEYLFKWQLSNFIKKETLAQVLSCEFCEFFKNTFFIEHLRWLLLNLNPFIQGLLERPFGEFFSSNVSLWNKYKYNAFNIFSCRIMIIPYKVLIVNHFIIKQMN